MIRNLFNSAIVRSQLEWPNCKLNCSVWSLHTLSPTGWVTAAIYKPTCVFLTHHRVTVKSSWDWVTSLSVRPRLQLVQRPQDDADWELHSTDESRGFHLRRQAHRPGKHSTAAFNDACRAYATSMTSVRPSVRLSVRLEWPARWAKALSGNPPLFG